MSRPGPGHLGRLHRLGHLVRRWRGSLSSSPPDPGEAAWAEGWLSSGELALWRRLGNVDRRHAITVARRFAEGVAGGGGFCAKQVPSQPARAGETLRAAMAGALLHDIGKLDAGLGTLGRVAATVVGPRTARFRTYHDHERLGAAMLADSGSSRHTVDLVLRRGEYADALEAADDI